MKKTKIRKFMKRVIAFAMTVAIVLGVMPPAYVSAAASFKWLGADGKAKVDTGFGNETNTEGIWFVATDNADGGESKVEFDKADPAGDKSVITDADVEMYKGISGKAILDKGLLMYQPLVEIGFPIVGEKSNIDDSYAATDATEWGGLTISYACDTDAVLELDLGSYNTVIGHALPECGLKKTTDGEVAVKKSHGAISSSRPGIMGQQKYQELTPLHSW